MQDVGKGDFDIDAAARREKLHHAVRGQEAGEQAAHLVPANEHQQRGLVPAEFGPGCNSKYGGFGHSKLLNMSALPLLEARPRGDDPAKQTSGTGSPVPSSRSSRIRAAAEPF